MPRRMSGKARGLVLLAILVVAVLLTDRVLWPRYSRERYIDPDEVRLVVIPPYEWRDTREVGAENEPRLLRRVIGALNGARSWTRYKLGFDSEIVIHRRRKASILIRYGQLRDGGATLFRDESRGPYGSRNLYRSAALRRALDAIRDSKQCAVEHPRIPARCLGQLVLYAGGSYRTLAGSSPLARGFVSALNDCLKSVDTSVYYASGDATDRSFYLGQVQPHTHLSGMTGALLILDPPLSMHTTVMFPLPYARAPAEYHELKTDRVLLWRELSGKSKVVVAFSSNAGRNRFYLFYFYPPVSGGRQEDREAGERWNNIIRVIEETVAGSTVRGR